MEKDLIKFIENIKDLGSKEIVQYEDEKGNLVLLPISQLFLSCEYVELEEAQLKIAVFNKQLDENLELEKATVTKKKDKYEITKREKDKGTIIDTEVEVSKVWFVKNGIQMSKAYNNKEEALKYVKEYNNKLMKIAKLIEE